MDLSIQQATTLLNHFTTFLTASIHTILYHRALYPPETFLTTRSHNLPIHQSRHPDLCAWINDAVSAVASQIREASARRAAMVIHAPPEQDGAVVERWVFDLDGWPAWPAEARRVGGKGKGKDRTTAEDEDGGEEGVGGVNWVDVEEQLRAALGRISYKAEGLGRLPEGCTFIIAVELKDDAPAPIGHPQPWIPSQPSLQPSSASRPVQGKDIGGDTIPIRSVEAGPLFFECWIEEGDAELQETLKLQAEEAIKNKSQGVPLA